jgi:nitrogen fixation/metabolism regulation signal transduction histidine kinase
MTLKRWVIVYLIALHLILATSFVWLLWESRLWLFAVEVVFLVSFSTAIILFNHIFNPPQVSALGSEFLKEQDFQSKFRTVGHPEVDRLVRLYNAIAQSLQDERIRLEEQEYFLGKLLDASPSGVVICDLDRRITLVNPAAERILNAKSDDLIGRQMADTGSHLTSELSSLAVGESAVIALPGRRQIKGWKSQLMDRGFPREFVMFEELTDEIRRLEKDSYEKLIRLMSHEVNNTIGAANSLLHSCLHYASQIRPEDRADYEGALNTTITRTEHLNTFMRAFSDLVRLPRPQLREYDLLTLVRNSVTLHRPEMEKRRIKVAWRTEPATLMAKVDIGQIEQVLVNLIKNAIEAIGHDGTITIVTRTSGDGPFLSIEDTGAGIPQEATAKLFTPFFTTKAGGQGIGLTFAAEVLTQHGFRFALTSEPGLTRFRILF